MKLQKSNWFQFSVRLWVSQQVGKVSHNCCLCFGCFSTFLCLFVLWPNRDVNKNIWLNKIMFFVLFPPSTDVSSDEAAARGGGPERRAASGVATQTAGAGPGHLQVHQHLWDPRVLHPARGGQRRLWPHPDMSRGTNTQKNVKHLSVWWSNKAALRQEII